MHRMTLRIGAVALALGLTAVTAPSASAAPTPTAPATPAAAPAATAPPASPQAARVAIEAQAPTFDAAGWKVFAPAQAGVTFHVAGWNGENPIPAGTWADVQSLAGSSVRVYAKPVDPAASFLAGQVTWTEAFPKKVAYAPSFDDLTSTLTIPDDPGYTYNVSDTKGVLGDPIAPGTHQLQVPFGGMYQFVTATPRTGATPKPVLWQHRYPEVVEVTAPRWEDAGLRVLAPSHKGVQTFVSGWKNEDPMRAASWEDMSQFAGKVAHAYARAASPAVTLLKGTTDWYHGFPAKSVPPTFDDLASTITIPEAADVEYLVDGEVVAAGTHAYTIPFGGQYKTVTVRSTTGAPNPAPAEWKHRFPEVVEVTAPRFDAGGLRILAPSHKGVQTFVEGWNDGQPMRAASWENMSQFAGQTVRVYAKAAVPAVTLLKGQTEWFFTFPVRPDYSIATGDEFDHPGLSPQWNSPDEVTPSKGKSVYRYENLSFHDGVMDVAIKRHCLKANDELVSDANFTEDVCPAGTITRYSTGRINSGFIYGAPKSMEVRAKLDADHHGITSTGWMHNDQKFCNATTGVGTSEIAEFDVMEIWDYRYTKSFSHMTCDNFGYHTVGVETQTDVSGAWHTWRVEWDGYALRYYFDGNLQSGPQGSAVTGAAAGISQERFASAINDHMWQMVINVNTPPDGNWAPWIDDTKPFRVRHDLYDYIRYEPFTGAEACAPVGAIGQAYAGRPDLGTPVGCERDAEVPGARVQAFSNGRIYWSPSTGAQVVTGRVLDKFLADGAERAHGLPTEPAVAIRDGGTSQRFERATIFFSPASGAHFVRGRVLAKYAEMGWETSGFGYPVTDEICGLRDGGCFQRFQGSDGQIYWSPATDAHFIRGRIFAKYADLGFETGGFGYPVTDEICGMRDGGCFQRFQGADGHIYWSPATDAHFVRGRIFAKYADLGWENGVLGYPVTDEICGMRDGGCFQRFQHEAGHVYWSPATDAHGIWGRLVGAYAGLGWETGAFGYPVSDPICGLRDGGCVQRFQRENGLLYVSNATAAYGVQGLISAYYASLGWENGRLGYPTGPEQCREVPGGRECTQSFQRGTVVWSSLTGLRG